MAFMADGLIMACKPVAVGSRFRVLDAKGETVVFKENETREALQDGSRFPLKIHFQARKALQKPLRAPVGGGRLGARLFEGLLE